MRSRKNRCISRAVYLRFLWRDWGRAPERLDRRAHIHRAPMCASARHTESRARHEGAKPISSASEARGGRVRVEYETTAMVTQIAMCIRRLSYTVAVLMMTVMRSLRQRKAELAMPGPENAMDRTASERNLGTLPTQVLNTCANKRISL